MEKAKKLSWFNEIMKTKMLKHKENPFEMTYKELFDWLDEEVAELKEAIQIGSRAEIIKECADVANIVYFIAVKVKRGI